MDLLKRIVLASTNKNDIVLDPFCGSGTTGVACMLNNRSFIGIEIEKSYCDLAKKRLMSKLPQNIENLDTLHEDEKYLTEQVITYIGNKRSLLKFIAKGIQIVQKRLNKNKLIIFDVFSGSGIVARLFK
ncbi:DNA methyltransferase, partial [Treponema sp. R80B11-R83G3]